MKVASPLLCRAALVSAACLLTQCAMPPRDAWRIVQNDGLIPYMMGSYETPAGPAQSRYLATSSPLQTTPASMATAEVLPRVPERENYVPNRYLAGSYYQQDKAPRSKPRVESEPPPPPRRTVIEEDDSPPVIVSNSEPKLNKPKAPAVKKDKPTEPPAKLEPEELPYGTPVSGRPGMVNSPFATKDQLVDVTGMSVGETVKCPYSGKLFRVPPSQQATAPKSTPPVPEPPVETSPQPEPEAAPSPSTPAPEPKASATSPEPEAPAADAGKPKL